MRERGCSSSRRKLPLNQSIDQNTSLSYPSFPISARLKDVAQSLGVTCKRTNLKISAKIEKKRIHAQKVASIFNKQLIAVGTENEKNYSH